MSSIGFSSSRHGCKRCANERGAGIVEFALVALLLFTLAAGGYDYGQAWRTGLTVNEAARTGARVGSAGGNDRAADFNALSGLKASLDSSGKLPDVVRVVVFRSDRDDGKMPTACKTGTSSLCQVIPGNAFRSNWQEQPLNSATQTNGCLQVATSRNWCPTSRDNKQRTAQFYGVWVQLRHDFMFPVMGSGTNVERTAVMRLEPKAE